ncbi:HAD-IIIA family hydrolase [Dactylosporangium sp. NPDC049140]|uniref:HAD-IIIA family hydrolase n=1 Tax=Dactylosporangium sp. NPDC049140 TaxID=3155647 RepID=UPI00340E5A32
MNLFDAVLFDRDGTLVEDVPYNNDPALVRPLPGTRAALDRLRATGLRLGVATNQSGLARGLITAEQLHRVNARIEELLGPFDIWQVCPHDDAAGCPCRKPRPGLVRAAARDLHTTPERCVVVGAAGRDMEAALAAGAAGILVPTGLTRRPEVAAAPAVAADLRGAAEMILQRDELHPSGPRTPHTAGTVLVVRPDSAGGVLVTGPAIRAVAAGAARVVLLCGPRGRAAAGLLPGVDEVIEWRLPWIDPEPDPVATDAIDALVARLAAAGADEAVVFTSSDQSPLPTALLLRLAGVGRISAISTDYPGSLLDVRHRVPGGIPEAERALSLAMAAGFPPPPGDDLRLRVKEQPPPGNDLRLRVKEQPPPGDDRPLHTGELPPVHQAGPYVVVHPGASGAARAAPADVQRRIVKVLTAAGWNVLVTGSTGEKALTAEVAGDFGTDLGGATGLAELATLLAGAGCLVVGNTGPAHLAAAVGTPVVSLFAPTVHFGQWAPFRVPVVRLGDAAAPCRDTRAVACPIGGHPCLAGVDPAAVVAAAELLGSRRRP